MQRKNIINGVSFQLFIAEMKRDKATIFEYLRGYCSENNYQGGLLDLYNKTYQLNILGMSEYLAFNLPAKYLKDIIYGKDKDETMHSKLSEMLLSNNKAIQRHAKGIYKELQKK